MPGKVIVKQEPPSEESESAPTRSGRRARKRKKKYDDDGKKEKFNKSFERFEKKNIFFQIVKKMNKINSSVKLHPSPKTRKTTKKI